jgi:glycosyltransferase involved in cell wall biosynthesis
MIFLKTEISLPDYTPVTDHVQHGPFMMWLVKAMQPRRIVAVGPNVDYPYFAMCQAVQEAGLATTCRAVWLGPDMLPKDIDPEKYNGFSQLLGAGAANLSEIADGSVDLLYLANAAKDFSAWRPKLSDGAVVVFGAGDEPDTQPLWADLDRARPALWLETGLGVLFWGQSIAQGLRELSEFTAKPQQAALAAAVFAIAGEQVAVAQKLRLATRTAEVQAETARSLQANLETRLAEAEHRRQQSVAAAQQADQLPVELADARQNPAKTLLEKYKSKLLYALARQTKLFSQRRRNNFLRSAQKRDPRRSLPGFNLVTNAAEAGTKPALFAGRSQAAPKPDAQTVMVVSHDASRTGAPILALNLLRELSKRYNVVTVLLGGGELVDGFTADSVATLHLDRGRMLSFEIAHKVAEFSKKHGVTKAFVNSVESRAVLPGLKRVAVPSVALLHEFASSVRPESAFADVFSNADQVVFSARLTLDNATSERGLEHPVNVHLLPQGKCGVPKKAGPEAEQAQERQWLDTILRPGGAEDREFVVIGAGAIEPRKGVDLFIETATRMIAANGGARFRFVWIGHGYDPVKDRNTSGFLADQIARAGVHAQVQIIRATSEIEHAYGLADLMLMSSRLDPLPNVAIDMLLAGKPVMCFDRTTGIVDFLDDSGLRDACVASYLDTAEMAHKIIALANDPALLAQVAEVGCQRARAVFDFPAYVARLDEIASASGVKEARIAADLDYVQTSGAFVSNRLQDVAKGRTASEKPIRKYLEANRSGPHFRRPTPGFNPLIYAEEHGWGGSEDPFVQFLKAGCPAGRWSLPVIDQDSTLKANAVAQPRVALHVHVFYIEEFKAILDRLAQNQSRPTLFVSTPGRILDKVKDSLRDYAGPVGAVQATPNRGRDIAPLLTVFGPTLVAGFDIVGHLHTKRSMDVNDRDAILRWTTFLLENTVGGAVGGPMMDRILAAMTDAPDLGIVYPADPQIMGWTRNRRQANAIAARMGFETLPEKIDFPIGTMFWMRVDVLKRFVDMNLGWDDYPAEPVPYDGSMLHAIERLFGVVPCLLGQRAGVTSVKGVTR